MLFVFSVLLLKSAFVSENASESCYEFAHIHKFHFKKEAPITIGSTSDGKNHKDDDSCHSGNILSGMFIFTEPSFVIPKISIEQAPQKISFLENFYLNPVIEPLKEPPKKV